MSGFQESAGTRPTRKAYGISRPLLAEKYTAKPRGAQDRICTREDSPKCEEGREYRDCGTRPGG